MVQVKRGELKWLLETLNRYQRGILVLTTMILPHITALHIILLAQVAAQAQVHPNHHIDHHVIVLVHVAQANQADPENLEEIEKKEKKEEDKDIKLHLS